MISPEEMAGIIPAPGRPRSRDNLGMRPPPFSAPQITEQQMNSFVKYALPIAAFLFIVWWVWSAAKRQRKF